MYNHHHFRHISDESSLHHVTSVMHQIFVWTLKFYWSHDLPNFLFLSGFAITYFCVLYSIHLDPLDLITFSVLGNRSSSLCNILHYRRHAGCVCQCGWACNPSCHDSARTSPRSKAHAVAVCNREVSSSWKLQGQLWVGRPTDCGRDHDLYCQGTCLQDQNVPSFMVYLKYSNSPATCF